MSFNTNNTLTTDVTFVPDVASAATSSFVINSNTAVANNSNTLTAVLTLLDAQSNPIVGVTPFFGASDSNTTVTPSGATQANGQASASYRTALAQNENATVTASGLNFSATMAFTPGPPTAAASSLYANPNNVAGNGTATISLVTTARDVQGNPVPGVSVALSASGTNNTFAAATGTTLSNGTYTPTLKSTKMQSETVTALIAGSVSETATVIFTGNANATTSTMTRTPSSQTVGPSNVITATLTLRDAANNPVVGVTPIWTASGSNTTIVSSGVTSSSGTATATYSSTLAQNENALVAASPVNLSVPLTFTAGSPNATTSFLFSRPNRQVANNSNAILVKLTLLDVYNNPVAGQTATFSATGSNTTVSGPATTSSAGNAQATYQSNTIQSENATVSAGGVSLSLPIVFTDQPAQCTLVANPNTQTADGNSAIGLLATVTNSMSQPVANVQVGFSSAGAAQIFSAQTAITTASGQASSSLRSLYAGSDKIIAQAGNIQCASQGNF